MKFVRALIVGAGVSVVSGCASLGIGDSEFSCSGLPEATTCMSAREVYEATAHGGTIYDRDYSGAKTAVTDDPSIFSRSRPRSKEQRLSGTDSASTSGVQTEQIVRKIEDRYVAPSVPNKPVPIRTPAQVMRVWIAPWEDKNENLKISSYVFTEIEARKWMYDMRGVARGETIQPLQVIRSDGDDINVDKRGHRNNRPTFDGSLPAPDQ